MRATSTTADPLRGRVTVVTAAAGYGKTTAVRGWLRGRPARWLHATDVPPEDPIAAGGDSVVVVDDLHLGPAEPPAARLTGAARLVLVTRRPLSTMDLRRYGEPPALIGPARLALSPERTAQLLRRRYDLAPADLAARLHALTAGWPALVHLAGGILTGDPALARRPARAGAPDPLLDALAAPGTPLFDYVAAEILDGLPPETGRLFRDVAELGLMGTDLADALGHERADAGIALLARLGLLDPPAPGHDWYRPVPAVAAVARRAPGAAVRRDAVVATAIEWHAGHGRPADALRLAVAAGDDARCAGLLREHGAELLAGGHAPAVVSGVRALPARFRDQH
ncbi:MAG TPA: hypothetical protein VFR67_19510, partial [Pilimelia sp.]|nr:hypothetical protein [Pilimelia sp.]